MIVDQLKCGGCGCEAMLMYNVRKSGSSRQDMQCLFAQCTQCGSRTAIEVRPAEIVLQSPDETKNWPKGLYAGPDTGVLCGGWADTGEEA